jgi:hypothetical protein
MGNQFTLPMGNHMIYIKPNQWGGYSREQAETISFASDDKRIPRFDAQIHLLQVGPDQWASSLAFAFAMGDYRGSSEPLSIHRLHNSRTDALTHQMTRLINQMQVMIGTGPKGCQSEGQIDVARQMLKIFQQYTGDTTDDGQMQMFGALIS